MNLGSIGYGIGALAFAALTLLLAAAWHGKRDGLRVLLASFVSFLWCLLLAWETRSASLSLITVAFAELLRDGMWLAVLCGIASPILSKRWVQGAYAAWVLCIAATALSPVLNALGILSITPWLVLSRACLAMSILNLLLLEQIYRNATPETRTVLRSYVLGFGALMAYDVFLYSQAELLRGIVVDVWNARGFVNAAAVPVIVLAIRAQPLWSLEIFVSRQFVLYTATLTAVGAYLVAMAIGGYWVRARGGTWGGVAQILFFGAACAVLVALAMSDNLRRRAKVFLSKHFYRNKYDYRLEWLRFIETLSGSSGSDVRQVCLQAIAQVFSSPGGVLYQFHPDELRYVPVARWPEGLDAEYVFPVIDANTELVRLLRVRNWIVDLDEDNQRHALCARLELPNALSQHASVRIIAPILQLDRLIGLVVLYSPPAPFELTYEDRDLLRTLGRHVAMHLAQMEADRALAESRQFDAYNKLTAFMMHDLKNSVAQLKLIVSNAPRHKNNPQFIDDVIDTASNTVDRINRLIEQLRNSDAPQSKPVPLPPLIEAALRRCRLRKPQPTLATPVPPVEVVADQERLTTIFEHVLRNAQDATHESGQIELSVTHDDRTVTVSISDTGSGMDQEFVRERLFRPFDSTKGAKGMGVGAYQVREYVRWLGGQVKVQSAPGTGTCFYITLPCFNAVSRTPQAVSAADAAATLDRGS